MVVVTADVARYYLDMRAEQARLDVLKKNIVVAQSGQELAQTLFDRGLTNELDVALARRQVATFQAQVARAEAQIDASGNASRFCWGNTLRTSPRNLRSPAAFRPCRREFRPAGRWICCDDVLISQRPSVASRGRPRASALRLRNCFQTYS